MDHASPAISLLLPCAIVAAASIPLMLKLVPPNRLYGFRTRQTLADRETWYRANRFAGCALFIASAASAAFFAARPDDASGRSIAGLLALVVPLVAAIGASLAYARLALRRRE